MRYVVAVDGGGTSTRAVVADSAGRCLGYAKTGRGNPVSAGTDVALAAFRDSIGAALAQAGVVGGQVADVTFSMAGGIVGRQMEVFADLLSQLGISCHPVVEGDLLGLFCSGTHEPSGYLLASGTGSGAVRAVGGQMELTADGLGWLIGDEGSGFWIGHRVVVEAFAAWDRRGPQTALCDLLARELGVQPGEGRISGRPEVLDQALWKIYELRPVQLSQFSRLAFEATDDAVAGEIVRQAGDHLFESLRAVFSPDAGGPLVIGGGVLRNNPALVSYIRGRLGAELNWRPEVRVVKEGAIGAVVLALRHIGVGVDADIFNAIGSTLEALH